MARTSVVVMIAASACLGVMAAAQSMDPASSQTPETAFDPDRTGASEIIAWQQPVDGLEPPRLWDCERIVPEYREWIEADNDPQDWKYVGQTYREVGDGRLYDWAEWLEWYDSTCPAAGWLTGAGAVKSGAIADVTVANSGGSIASSVLTGLAINAAVVAVWTAANSEAVKTPARNDSPG